MYGKGRAFYGSFAHCPETCYDTNIYHMYYEAIRGALGMTTPMGKPDPRAGSIFQPSPEIPKRRRMNSRRPWKHCSKR